MATNRTPQTWQELADAAGKDGIVCEVAQRVGTKKYPREKTGTLTVKTVPGGKLFSHPGLYGEEMFVPNIFLRTQPSLKQVHVYLLEQAQEA